MSDNNHHVLQPRKRQGDLIYGIIASGDKRRSKKQVFSRIAAYRQLRCEQQARATLVCQVGRINDLFRIARKIANDKVELGNTEFESHEPRNRD